MKKILVPTDFSDHSKAGIRFAIQWASQQKAELIFIHILNIIRLTRWSDVYIQKLVNKEMNLAKKRIERFVLEIYKNMKVKPGKYACVVRRGISADLDIMEYCRKNPGIDYICISTRGGGKLKKILGTNTANLITKSLVPVLAVPENYRKSTIRKILYATDFRDYTNELEKVISFAKPLKADLQVLHYAWVDEVLFDKETLEKILRRQFKYKLAMQVKKTDGTHSLVQLLQTAIRYYKPSVLIMFTNQGRTLYQKIFLSSKAAELSFRSRVPLLVFKKGN